MHKFVALTFKILGLSLVFMLLLDTGLTVFQTVSVYNKVSTLTGLMQNEVAKNNCMPDTLADMFEVQLQRVVDDVSPITRGYKSNMTETVTSNDGTRYPSLSPDNTKQYGEITELYVAITMRPSFLIWRPAAGNTANQSLLSRAVNLDYDLEFTYHIPCLRYIK